MAEVFRDFLIQQLCRNVLALMANKQLLEAKKQLYCARELLSQSKQLRKLDSFTDYLLLRNQHQSVMNTD
jgi:hypothetical protein